MTAVIELDKAYRKTKADPSFQAELDELLKIMLDVKHRFITQSA